MDSKTVICDPGTGYMKMGFAGDNFPQAAFASLVGRPMLRFEESVGEEVQLKVRPFLPRKLWLATRRQSTEPCSS